MEKNIGKAFVTLSSLFLTSFGHESNEISENFISGLTISLLKFYFFPSAPRVSNTLLKAFSGSFGFAPKKSKCLFPPTLKHAGLLSLSDGWSD